ncbi:MAG: aminotransferase class I/II-fold pyridoxal phosphate-dependent enzyme [Bacteroidota bacterium]
MNEQTLDAAAFRRHAHEIVDWMADYLEQIEQYPVKSQVEARAIYNQLPASAPQEAESMAAIFKDFQEVIVPGITHWQSPNFFSYFPANSSYASLLGEMLTATLGAQCMIWETSPAAAELEERVMNWLGEMIGLPEEFSGVIQSTASDGTLIAILTAREKASNFQVNETGLRRHPQYRVYASGQTHSSIEKAVKIAGMGRENCVYVATDANYAMDPAALQKTLQADLQAGLKPLCVVATLGTTSSTAIDPLAPIAKICQEYGIWLHVDAAYAGNALILPEYRDWIKGIEGVDSFVFNPHKWLFTNFDCTAYFVRSEEYLIRTFEILPEYLKTRNDKIVKNYRDWGVALGRRFRALKLWFVLRNFGVKGLQAKLRLHMQLGQWLKKQVEAHPDFELLAPVPLNLVCFRYRPGEALSEAQLTQLNQNLVQRLNDGGKIYLTHTKLNGVYTIRLVAGQTHVEQKHIEAAWDLIVKTAKEAFHEMD